MKLLISITLWLAAIALAGFVLWCLVRRKPMVLRGRVGRRAVRLAAVVLVGLGLGAGESGAAAQPGDDTAESSNSPPTSLEDPARQWREQDHTPGRRVDPGIAPPIHAAGPDSERAALAAFARSLQDTIPSRAARDFAADVFTAQDLVARWRDDAEGEHPRPGPDLVGDSPALWAVVSDGLDADADPGTAPAGYTALDVSAALDEVLSADRLHPKLNAYLWGKLMALPVPDDIDQARAFAQALWRVERNGRLLHAMVRAEHHTGLTALFGTMDPNPRAWMSKAGPSRQQRDAWAALDRLEARQLDEYARVVTRFYDAQDAGAWEDEGLALLRLGAGSGPVQVIHPQATRAMRTDTPTRLGRLDLIRSGPEGGRVVSDWLGVIDIPPDAVLRVVDLPALLDDTARARIGRAIDTVMRLDTLQPPGPAAERRSSDTPGEGDAATAPGDIRHDAEMALLLLERHMPLCYPQVRDAADAPAIGSYWPFTPRPVAGPRAGGLPGGDDSPPDASPGRAALRLLAQLFDESVFVGADRRLQPYGYALRTPQVPPPAPPRAE